MKLTDILDKDTRVAWGLIGTIVGAPVVIDALTYAALSHYDLNNGYECYGTLGITTIAGIVLGAKTAGWWYRTWVSPQRRADEKTPLTPPRRDFYD
jgi:hypothetical protein